MIVDLVKSLGNPIEIAQDIPLDSLGGDSHGISPYDMVPSKARSISSEIDTNLAAAE